MADENVRELDVRELNRMLKELTYTASMGLLNGTALPHATHGQVIGVIFIFRSCPDLFTQNDRVLLQSFADQAAIAVYNARLYGQASFEKQRLDALLDSAADGILILNADLTIERVNDAFERIYGKTHDELAILPHDEVIRWENEPQGATLKESIANGWPLTPNAGSFVMGDTNGSPDERQLTAVKIDQAFWMAKCEVSNEQFTKFNPRHDSRFEHRSSWWFDEESTRAGR